jgi:hypothetical protein
LIIARIGPVNQLKDDLPRFGVFEIKEYGFAAAKPDIEPWFTQSRFRATFALNANDLGAHVGQHLAAKGYSTDPTELDYPDSLQRSHLIYHLLSGHATPVQ